MRQNPTQKIDQKEHIEIRKKKITCEGSIGRGVGNSQKGKTAIKELEKGFKIVQCWHSLAT